MPTILTISSEEVRKLYATGKFTQNQLAKHLGVSRQAINYHLRVKVEREKNRKRITVRCDGCGKDFDFTRGPRAGRPGRFHYCGDPCKAPSEKEEIWRELAKEILE